MPAAEPEVPPDPRAFWSGTLTFGLVSVPVDLYPAVRPRRTPLRTLGVEAQPVVRRYYCSLDDTPLTNDDIVRGYENDDGSFTVVEDDELEALAPRKSRDIDLRRFVARDELPRQLLERPYILAPAGDSTKAYILLTATMERAGRAGIATFVMRGKEYLAAIFAEHGTLRAVTMRFSTELRTPQDVGLPAVSRPGDVRVKEMTRALAGLANDTLDATLLTDEYAAVLHALAAHKREQGQDVVEIEDVPEEEAAEEGVIDIMKILRERMGAGSPPADASAPARRGSRVAAGKRLADTKGRKVHHGGSGKRPAKAAAADQPSKERRPASKPAQGSRARRRTRRGTSRTP